MLFRLFFLIVFCLSIVSCQEEEVEAPPPIPPETLRTIIAELLILEPAGKEIPYVEQDSIYSIVYDRILKLHGHELSEFVESMRWLQRDPDRQAEQYELILEEVGMIEKK